MKRLMNQLFWSIFLLACTPTEGQDIVDVIDLISEKSTIQYSIGSTLYAAHKIIIELPENLGDVYLWVDDDIIAKESEYGRVRRYFNQRNGDYSLQELITEDLLRDHSPIIGKTYLKRLSSGAKFELILLLHDGRGMSSDNRIESWLNDHLVIQSADYVEQIVKINSVKLYQEDANFLVLRLDDFE